MHDSLYFDMDSEIHPSNTFFVVFDLILEEIPSLFDSISYTIYLKVYQVIVNCQFVTFTKPT